MNTIHDILTKTAGFFNKNGVPNPRLDAEYIVAHGLGLKRIELYQDLERPLTEPELALLRPLVARRAKREPLQHIVGNTSFRGYEIKCDARALIPRPETEDIVDLLKKKLGKTEGAKIVEIGTGTGAIAISCKLELADAQVLATDISEDALELAKENAELNNAEIEFLQGDLLEAVPEAEFPFDALVSNLPYVPTSEKPKLQPEVRFDPERALFAGQDGLQLIRKLLPQIPGKLKPGAPVILEIGTGQEQTLEREAANLAGLEWVAAHKDYCGNIRFAEYKVL